MVAEAFVGYRSFAPAGWQPPGAAEQADTLERWIADAGFWGALAEDHAGVAGFADFVPAMRHSVHPSPHPEMAYLGHLFLAERHWGTGLAARLLACACEAARGRGYRRIRLFVAEGHARARRFYAREGFTEAAETVQSGIGLPMLTCQRPLPPD
jgi:GNAT superfamily N-acetyltransferase